VSDVGSEGLYLPLSSKLNLKLDAVETQLQGLLASQLVMRDNERFLGRSTYPTLPIVTDAPERAELLQSAQRALLNSGKDGQSWNDVLLLKEESIPKMQALCAEFIARMRQLSSEDGVPFGINLWSFPIVNSKAGFVPPVAEYSRSH
jgi:hypothetical protein